MRGHTVHVLHPPEGGGREMTLVVHWGDREKSIFDGFPWEIHSSRKILTLFNAHGGDCGEIPVKDMHAPTDTSTVYHVYTDATDWSRS